MTNLEIPIFRIDLTQGFDAPEVALVSAPAIEEDFMAFASITDDEMQFAEVTTDKMELVGPVMIPYKKIDRSFGQVYFTEEDTDKFLEYYAKTGYKLNLYHTAEKIDQFVKEVWQVEDPKTDKSVALGLGEFPKGTIMQRVKINDQKFWNEQIKTKKIKGFSIQFKNPSFANVSEGDMNMLFETELAMTTQQLEGLIAELNEVGELQFAVDARKLRSAMTSKRVVDIYYEGDNVTAPGFRTIEIFTYGLTLAGNRAIRAWIRPGSASSSAGKIRTGSNADNGWRMFLLKKITKWVEAKTQFTGLRPGYNPRDLGLSVIYQTQ